MFSIIIPVFNKLPHLKRCLDSVFSQTYQNYEVILVDDGSTDGSYEYLKGFIRENVFLYRRRSPGAGGYAARNLGIKKAKFDWIAFLDSDDEWMPNKLISVLDVIQKFPDCNFITSGWLEKRTSNSSTDHYFDHNYKYGTHYFDLYHFISNSQLVCTNVAVVKKIVLEKLNGFDKDWKMGADLDMWLRILMLGIKGIWINKVLAVYYLDSINMVTNKTVFLNSPAIPTLNKYINSGKEKDSDKINLLKKYSNRIIWYTVRKRLKRNISYKSVIFSDFYFSINLLDKIYIRVIFFMVIPYNLAFYLYKNRFI